MMLQLAQGQNLVLINAVANSALTEPGSRELLRELTVYYSTSDQKLVINLISEEGDFFWLVSPSAVGEAVRIPFKDAPGFIDYFRANGALTRAFARFDNEMTRRVLEAAKLLLGAEVTQYIAGKRVI